MGKLLFSETKQLQIQRNISHNDCLFNYKNALLISQFFNIREDEALIQLHIAMTMNDMGMAHGAITHCENAVKIFKNHEVNQESNLTKEAENLLHALKFDGMVSDMVGKLTSDEDCIILGPLQRMFD